MEFQLRDKNLTWSTWALTSLPALPFSCKPVYLHYTDSSPFQDRKSMFTYTEGNQQEEYNGSPHLQSWPCREASLPRSNSFLYHFQIHCNIPIKEKKKKKKKTINLYQESVLLNTLLSAGTEKSVQRQANIITHNIQAMTQRQEKKDHSQIHGEALSLERVLCSSSLRPQRRTAQVKSYVYKAKLKARSRTAAQTWYLLTHSGTLNVPRLSRRICTSLSTLIIWGTIVLALPLHQVSKNQASTLVDSCFDFPAHCKKLKEILIKNKQKPKFQVFQDITQTHQLLLKKIYTHSKPSFLHIKQ